jgi:hypothetical protein
MCMYLVTRLGTLKYSETLITKLTFQADRKGERDTPRPKFKPTHPETKLPKLGFTHIL